MPSAGMEPQTPRMVRYEALVQISFVRPLAEMSLAELVGSAQELRALRSIRSLDTRGPVYQELARLETLVIDQAARYLPDPAVRAERFDPSGLFPIASDFLQVFDRVRISSEITPVQVLPAELSAVSRQRSGDGTPGR